jgi:excisionase family DNA binding protein
MSESKLLSIPQAASQIGLSRASLYRAVNNGLLPLGKIGGRSLVDPTDLTALVNASKRTIAA